MFSASMLQIDYPFFLKLNLEKFWEDLFILDQTRQMENCLI